jgi:hypothetical protein
VNNNKLGRLNKLVEYLIYTNQISFKAVQTEIANRINANPVSISRAFAGEEKYLTDSLMERINDAFDSPYSKNWLLTGEIEMLKTETSKKLIPFYDDTTTIGGVNNEVANIQGVSSPTEYIDTGDWFRDATAAIRHYGESMTEYPSGCILALKEVIDRELIIPGLDYMIETSEYRVTKRIQKGKDTEHITAYSTNPETYPDRRLIHEPFDIPWRSVRHIALVLGYVVKKNGGTLVYNNTR